MSASKRTNETTTPAASTDGEDRSPATETGGVTATYDLGVRGMGGPCACPRCKEDEEFAAQVRARELRGR